jgi:hypothetical protein
VYQRPFNGGGLQFREDLRPMNFNFFDWIRQGVKQSVLLGVSDAVGHLGTPRADDDVSQRLLSFLQESPAAAPARQIGVSPKHRKLGRTLEQIQAAAPKNP